MNNNTRLRVRVPKALYESIQAELSKKKINESSDQPYYQIAAKAIDNALQHEDNKQGKLDILINLKDAVEKKIKEMHSPSNNNQGNSKKINESDEKKASVQEIAAVIDKAVIFIKKLAQQIADKKGGSLTRKDVSRLVDNFGYKITDFGPFRMSTSQDNQSYVDDFMANAYPNPNMTSPLGENEEETKSSTIDDKFMKTLSPAIKLANSKITNQKDFADFVLKFAEEVLSNEQFAGTTGENSNYKNAIRHLSSVAGKMQSSETPKSGG